MVNFLKEIRKKQGLTQMQLSQMANVPRVCISRYESGKYHPSIENAAKLSIALGVPLDALIQPREDGKTA